MYNEMCPSNSTHYVVKNGDTLWRLSQTYGVSVQSILDLNPGVNPQNLQIGSTLCLPHPLPTKGSLVTKVPPSVPSPSVTCPTGAFSYTVQGGDTIWRLSQTYGVSVQSILDLNAGVDPQNLQIGSTLCIPQALTPTAPQTTQIFPIAPAPPCSTGEFAYLIKEGDSICRIARKFYISVESILKRNPGINSSFLQTGTYICLPMNCCGRNTCRYFVRAGDTLNRIANKFNVCPSALVAANPNIDFRHLVRCQIICVPLG
jgi:LysM repeat protein